MIPAEAITLADVGVCEMCGADMDEPPAAIVEVWEATGFIVCAACVEATLEAAS